MDQTPLNPECRICFEGDDNGPSGNLIYPCSCSGSHKYVHENCLQRWRRENYGRKYNKVCEICGASYLIISPYQCETFILPQTGLWGMVLAVVGIATLSCIIYEVDSHDGYVSLKILQREPDKTFILGFERGDIIIFSYYALYSAYIISMLFYLCLFVGACLKIRRKCHYWKKKARAYLMAIPLSSSYFYLYGLYLVTDTIFLYIIFAPAFVILDALIIELFMSNHNRIVKNMNELYNAETVMSVESNPMLTIQIGEGNQQESSDEYPVIVESEESQESEDSEDLEEP